MYKRKKKRALVFSLVLAATMLSAPSVQAQGIHGNLLDDYYAGKDKKSNSGGLMGRGSFGGYNLSNQQFGSDSHSGYQLSNQTFGQENEGPLGSGLAILMVAGMGYAAMKSRKKNQKSNK